MLIAAWCTCLCLGARGDQVVDPPQWVAALLAIAPMAGIYTERAIR
jgi:hypothetical protein